MTVKSKMIGLRTTIEDAALFEQAADQSGLSMSNWMREHLKLAAIKQVYSKNDPSDFPSTPGETVLLRAVLVILQTVNVDTPEELKQFYSEKATRQIERIKEGK